MEKHILQTDVGDIAVYIQDNKMANTVLFIHGFNSSHAFAKSIYDQKNNFNIITFDYPRVNVHFERLVAILDEVTRKLLKGRKFFYLGHSLGGAISLSARETERIAGRILVSPLNPSLTKATSYTRLEMAVKPIGAMQRVGARIVKATAHVWARIKDMPLIAEFVSGESDYQDVIDHTILNREFLEHDLLEKYLCYPAHYFIGEADTIIPTALFVEFVNSELGREVTVVANARHNPFKDNPEAMHAALNQIVPAKKRWAFIKFYSLKNIKKNKKAIKSGKESKNEY